VPVTVQAHTKSVLGSLKLGRPMPAKNLRARNTSYAARYFDPNRQIAPSMDSTVVTLLRKCAFPMFYATPHLDYDSAAAAICLLRSIRGNARNGASPAALSSDSSQPRCIICTVVNPPLTVSAAGTCSSRQTGTRHHAERRCRSRFRTKGMSARNRRPARSAL
jgi:hypothetical protein